MDLGEPLVPIIVVSGVLWAGLAVAVGLLAERRGSSGLLWFLLAVFATPIVAPLLLLIITPEGRPRGRA